MSELKIEKYSMQAAMLSDENNPLPMLKPLVNWKAVGKKGIIEDDDKYFNYGSPAPLLPYKVQDNYNRSLKPAEFKAIVLENKYLKAVFLPELGGRLWSLYHKLADRELLYVNPIFQPANFAFRNAWVSGGIEWNMGMPAHNPFTCDDVFAATVKYDEFPVLRIYEWERVRNAPFQIDFYLPDDSKILFARTKLFNPHDYEIAAYWYTNIAVPEAQGTRVLSPSDYAYTFDYENKNIFEQRDVVGTSIPYRQGNDVTYPVNINQANDYFYRIDTAKQMPWIASVDSKGRGFFEASTQKLKGRKVFIWGMNTGGRTWQKFLTKPDNPYVEIQAGLGRTQVECLPFHSDSTLEWLECFGLIECEVSVVHGKDWNAARSETEKRITNHISRDCLESQLRKTTAISTAEVDQVIHHGSGWGALEQRRMGRVVSPSLKFDNSTLGIEQEKWLKLLENGEFECESEENHPTSYMTDSNWQLLLERAVAQGNANNWFSWFHLGIMRYVNNGTGAAEAWKESIKQKPNIWSYWALSQYYLASGDENLAINMLDKAVQIQYLPDLMIAFCDILIDLKRFEKIDKVLQKCTKKDLEKPRLRLAKAVYLAFVGKYEQAENILDGFVLPDLRENANVLSDLWLEIQAGKRVKAGVGSLEDERKYVRENLQVPAGIDFRMS